MGVFLFSRKDGETQRSIESSPLRLSCFAALRDYFFSRGSIPKNNADKSLAKNKKSAGLFS